MQIQNYTGDMTLLFIFGLIILFASLAFVIAIGVSIISISSSLRDIRDLEFKKWKESHQNDTSNP